jgi:hypothetical protein
MKVKVYYIPNYFVNYITLQFFTVLKYFEIKTIHPWEEEQIVIGQKKKQKAQNKSLLHDRQTGQNVAGRLKGCFDKCEGSV